MTDINTQIGAQVEGISPDDPQSLNDVGITFTNQAATSTAPEVDNILTVNDGTLSSALSTNFQGVSNLFGFNLTSDSTDLAVYSHTNALSASNFTLNIDPGSNTFTATVGTTTVNLTAQALTGGVAGYTLTGPAGSALDGLVLIYASDSPATVHVTATQGVADKQYSTLNAALTANTGTLAVELTSLQGSDTKLNNDITQQNTFINQYQDQLTQQFAALEQAISNTNSLLDALSANDAARLEASSIS
jgi:flagellar capping protein FliD